MRKTYLVALVAGILAAGCHHYAPTDTSTEEVKLVDMSAIEAFAADAVYTAHPTRALVDRIDVMPAAELGRYMVHIEMTGGTEFRDIFDLVVIEGDDGDLSVESLVQIQGN